MMIPITHASERHRGTNALEVAAILRTKIELKIATNDQTTRKNHSKKHEKTFMQS